MIQKARDRGTKTSGSFKIFSNLNWPEDAVQKQFNLTTQVDFYNLPGFVKVTAKTCKLEYQLVIG